MVTRVRVIVSNFDYQGKQVIAIFCACSGLLQPHIPLGRDLYTPDGKIRSTGVLYRLCAYPCFSVRAGFRPRKRRKMQAKKGPHSRKHASRPKTAQGSRKTLDILRIGGVGTVKPRPTACGSARLNSHAVSEGKIYGFLPSQRKEPRPCGFGPCIYSKTF